MKRAALIPYFAAICICGCVNPAASVKNDVAEFVQQFPDHIVSVKVPERASGSQTSAERSPHLKAHDKSLRYAWIGERDKRPVLLVHGSPGSWDGWAHFLLDKKLQEHFQVIAVDRPGFGGSDEGVSERSVQKQADLVAEALKINTSGLPAILVGHSYGGPVVAQLAMSYPNRIGGVVFVASSVDPAMEKTKWYQYPASWWPIRVLIPSSLRVCNEEIFALKDELTRMLATWSQFQAKAILIQGEDDPLVDPENLNFLNQHIDKGLIVKSVHVAGLNHFVPWKRPDLIFDGIWEIEKSLSK